jgi:hypothetical protein
MVWKHTHTHTHPHTHTHTRAHKGWSVLHSTYYLQPGHAQWKVRVKQDPTIENTGVENGVYRTISHWREDSEKDTRGAMDGCMQKNGSKLLDGRAAICSGHVQNIVPPFTVRRFAHWKGLTTLNSTNFQLYSTWQQLLHYKPTGPHISLNSNVLFHLVKALSGVCS